MTIQHLDKSKRLQILARAIFESKKEKTEAMRPVKRIEEEIKQYEEEVKELLGNGLGGYHHHRLEEKIDGGIVGLTIGSKTGGNHWMPHWEKDTVVLATAKYLKGKGLSPRKPETV